MKVMVALPTSEYSRRADFYDYYNQLIKPDGTVLCSAHGASPARNRNIMIRQALENQCTHIFFLDDDMAFAPDILNKLIMHDKDIITGLYLLRNYPHLPIIFEKEFMNGSNQFSFLSQGREGVHEITNTGFGCILFKISVFTTMLEKGLTFKDQAGEDIWVTLGELEKDQWSDDIAFFNRVRRAGIKMYVDLEITCGHMVTGIIWPKRDETGKWHTQIVTTASQEGIQFPQAVMDKEAIEKKLKDLKLEEAVI